MDQAFLILISCRGRLSLGILGAPLAVADTGRGLRVRARGVLLAGNMLHQSSRLHRRLTQRGMPGGCRHSSGIAWLTVVPSDQPGPQISFPFGSFRASLQSCLTLGGVSLYPILWDAVEARSRW